MTDWAWPAGSVVSDSGGCSFVFGLRPDRWFGWRSLGPEPPESERGQPDRGFLYQCGSGREAAKKGYEKHESSNYESHSSALTFALFFMSMVT